MSLKSTALTFFPRKMKYLTDRLPSFSLRSAFQTREVYLQMLLVLALVFATLFTTIISFVFMAASLGIETNWFLLSATVPLISFLSLMPISLGGWGVREFSSVYLLSFLGINAQHSLLVGISFGVLSTSVAALGFLPHIYRQRS